MRPKMALLTAVLLLALPPAQAQMSGEPQGAPKPRLSIGESLVRELALAESELVPLAEEMPAEKYSYAPTQGEFKGVRNFGQQLKHVAAANYIFFAILAGEKPPADTGEGENGPDSLRTKAEIVQYLKDSFAYGQKVLKGLKDSDATRWIKTPWGADTTPVSFATLTIAHCLNHYGQLVVYLRANGMVPPASRPQQP